MDENGLSYRLSYRLSYLESLEQSCYLNASEITLCKKRRAQPSRINRKLYKAPLYQSLEIWIAHPVTPLIAVFTTQMAAPQKSPC